MIYRTLGRTHLKVSALGMGTGGLDPMGVKSGRSEQEMRDFLCHAFDQGVRFFDTSPAYGNGRSERILGQAAGAIGRDRIIISTKMALAGGIPGESSNVMRPEEVAPALDKSLQRLRTDHVDVLLMAVADLPEHFDTVVDDLIPELIKLKEQGKIRFLGSSEQTRSDGAHAWLTHVLPTDQIDVAMVGHNMINQSAQRSVFPLCGERNLGVLNVFTVRNLFWNMSRLKQVITDLKVRGVIERDAVCDEDPLGWLVQDGRWESLVEAAYRYAAFTEGVTTVMCGTIDRGQLEQDMAFLEKGPLPDEQRQRLHQTFGHIAEPIGN